MILAVETEQETDRRWSAEIPQIPGAMYGANCGEAIARAKALALRVIADTKRTGLTPSHL